MVNKKEEAKKLYLKYQYIFKQLKIIGITGTDGKTSTTTIIYKYLKQLGYKVTLIGTNGAYIDEEYIELINTTPGIQDVYNILLRSYEKKIKYVIMEVSSHGICQYRVYKIPFVIRAITNITSDHLDYHYNIDNYKKAKGKFLIGNKKSKVILNADMKYFNYFYKNCHKKCSLYGMKKTTDFYQCKKIKIIRYLTTDESSEFLIQIKNKKYFFSTNLVGVFNIYNIVCSIAILQSIKKFEFNKFSAFLKKQLYIDGRMKKFNYNDKTIIIDFAHTPNAIKEVLIYINSTFQDKSIITVIGCGGNRDCTKRSIIGNIVTGYSDQVIFTSDNPRNEDPISIINDITKNINNSNYKVIVSRKEAIKEAINNYSNCVVAILGRGNEKYHYIKNEKIRFSDIDYVEELIGK